MKIILLYVSSIDGKLTKWRKGSSHLWASPEDQEQFYATLQANNLIVMGSNTFKTANIKPSPGKLRLVLTRNPQQFNQQTIPGQLEFSKESPEQLVKRLETLGFTQMLLVSGKTLTTAFLKQHLIDELWLTIEPKLFGKGDPLLEAVPFDITMQLLSIKKLNPQGTLLLKYHLLK